MAEFMGRSLGCWGRVGDIAMGTGIKRFWCKESDGVDALVWRAGLLVLTVALVWNVSGVCGFEQVVGLWWYPRT